LEEAMVCLAFALECGSVGDDGGDLDLDLGPVLDQGGDLDRGHGDVVEADDLAKRLADLAAGGEVLALARARTRSCARCASARRRRSQHGDDVGQRLRVCAAKSSVSQTPCGFQPTWPAT
jgi:hypothetical protein